MSDSYSAKVCKKLHFKSFGKANERHEQYFYFLIVLYLFYLKPNLSALLLTSPC